MGIYLFIRRLCLGLQVQLRFIIIGTLRTAIFCVTRWKINRLLDARSRCAETWQKLHFFTDDFTNLKPVEWEFRERTERCGESDCTVCVQSLRRTDASDRELCETQITFYELLCVACKNIYQSLSFMCGLKSSRSSRGLYNWGEEGNGFAHVVFCIGQHFSFFSLVSLNSIVRTSHSAPQFILFVRILFRFFFVTDYERLSIAGGWPH